MSRRKHLGPSVKLPVVIPKNLYLKLEQIKDNEIDIDMKVEKFIVEILKEFLTTIKD